MPTGVSPLAALTASPELLTEIVDQILVPLVQPMRLLADTGRPDPARPAAHCPAQHLKNTEREAPIALFQPGRVHRSGPFEERQADQSAMIYLVYAMSEPCGPWGVSPG